MNDSILKILISQINEEKIPFGELIVKLTYRNNKIQSYSLTTTKNILVAKMNAGDLKK